MDGLVKAAKSDNPWVVQSLWRDFRDAVEGRPWKAPEAPAERQLGRIVLNPGPGPSAPRVEPSAPVEEPRQHEEDGGLFVAVPPPDD